MFSTNEANQSGQEDDDEENSSGTVAAVVIVILLLVIIAVCGGLFFLHKQGKIELPFLPPSSNTKADGMNEREREMNGKSVPRAVNDYEKKMEERKNKAYVEEEYK